MVRFLIAVALMPVGYVLGVILAMVLMLFVDSREQVPVPVAAIRPAPTPIKGVPPPRRAPWPVPPYSGPRVMPPWPALPYSWKETPKEECEPLPDREEARLCAQYPRRESILNSAVLRNEPVHISAGVRFQYKVLKSCPIITSGEARALVCGKLAEQFELYCCK